MSPSSAERDADSLWSAGWSEMGSRYGVVRVDGAIEWQERQDAVVGLNSFLAHIAPAPDNKSIAASARSRRASQRRSVYRRDPKSAWAPLFAVGTTASPRRSRLSGGARDRMEGRRRPGHSRSAPVAARSPTIAHAADPGHPRRSDLVARYGSIPAPPCCSWRPAMRCCSRTIAAASRRGQSFTRLNVGDPGGAEFEDVLRGPRLVRRRRRCRRRARRRHRRQLWRLPDGVGGGHQRPLCAAVMVSGISDLLSYQYTANNGFSEGIIGAPLPAGTKTRPLYIERSLAPACEQEGAADSHPGRR